MSWNYNTVSGDFWNNTDRKWQEQMLTQYYPIGMQVDIIQDSYLIYHDDIDKGSTWTIIYYVYQGHYILNVKCNSTSSVKNMHPGFFKPTNKWLRKSKLERILNDKIKF